MPGETRIAYKPDGDDYVWKFSEWKPVEPEWDFTVQHVLEDLLPGRRYTVLAQSRATDPEKIGQEIKGGFFTAPKADDDSKIVEFAVSTGQAFWDRNSDDGFVIYDTLLEKHPELDFFVHTGDIVYYDRLAKTPGLANYHWQRTYSRPTNVRFHNRVASYFIKDDHDTWINDCWPTMETRVMGTFTFAQGLDIFVHQVPMHGRKTYRTQRWGKDLQVWMVEGRDFRSANTDPDGPEKTIWGEEQMAWFKKTFAESDATFRVLISPTPVVGPDRAKGKNDNHSNRVFTHEGDQVRDFLALQKNAFVVCGDRHWQYHSIDPRTKLHEFSCGPASDKHAGGWNQKNFMPEIHKFLRVKGGYLTVTTARIDGKPQIAFRHFSETGDLENEKIFK
ncbi:MAG: alkaline phosphatase [Verrucomicrobiales bacterium]|nr:alkaline phosphatase [Verrucomicrobiales bacterium]